MHGENTMEKEKKQIIKTDTLESVQTDSKQASNHHTERQTTPVIDLERHHENCSKLNDAIISKNEKNIAIAGIFGSGKSTFIKTYEYVFNNKNADTLLKKFNINIATDIEKKKLYKTLEAKKLKNKIPSLTISLANFNVVSDKQVKLSQKKKSIEIKRNKIEEDDENNQILINSENQLSERQLIEKSFQELNNFSEYRQIENSENEKDINKEIERNLLQQFFFGVKQRELPDSKINRITNKIYYKITSLITFIITLLSSSVCLINHFSLIWGYNSIVEKIFLSFSVLSLIILLTSIPFTVKIKSLKVDKIELNTMDNGDSGENLLNKYMDEIIYIFKRSKMQIVYFEDLDRLPNLNIFNKLRELNFILNNSPDIDKKIIFVYCVADSIIADYEERSKFFDTIITVPPFTTTENLKTKIENTLSNIKIKNIDMGLISEFALNMSKFMVDSRLSIYIENDFNSLLKKFEIQTLDTKQLIQTYTFAIYQNLYRYDYNKLSKNQACLNYAFQIIRYLRLDQKEIIEEKLKKEEELLQNRLNSRFLTPDIFRVFLSGIIYLFGKYDSYNSNSIDIEKTPFSELKSGKNYHLDFKTNGYGTIRKSISYEEIQSYCISTFQLSLSELIKSLESSNENELNKLIKKVENLREEQNEIMQISIIEFMEKYDCKEINNPFLFLCLSKGYIDSDFAKYCRTDEDKFLTDNDDVFVRYNIFNESNETLKNNFSAKLDNINKVIQNIPAERFEFPKILNFSLINFLLEDNLKESTKFKNLQTLLFSQNKTVKQFFIDYLKNQDIDNCIKICQIYYQSKEFIPALKSVIGFININKQNLILNYLINDSDLSKLNDNKEELLNIINNNMNWQEIRFNEKSIENLKSLGDTCLTNIDTLDKQSLKLIINNCIFLIDSSNLCYIAEKFLNTKEENTYINNLLKYDNIETHSYLISNLDKFILNFSGQEFESFIVDEILNSELDHETKQTFIEHNNFNYDITPNVDNEFLQIIVTNTKLSLTILNIFNAYKLLSEEPFENYFAPDIFHLISFDTLNNIKEDEDYANFMKNVIMPKIFENENNIEISQIFEINNVKLTTEITNLNKNSILRLVSNNLLEITSSNFNNLIEYPEVYIQLINKAHNDYYKLLEGKELRLTESLTAYLICNLQNQRIKELLINNYIDEINFFNQDSSGKILTLDLISEIQNAQITNKEVVIKIINLDIDTLKTQKLDILSINKNLFTSQEIYQLLCILDEEFSNCSNQKYDFALTIPSYIKKGLELLEEKEFLKINRRVQKSIQINKL